MRVTQVCLAVLYLILVVIVGLSVISCSYFGPREWAEDVLEWPNGSCTYLNKSLDSHQADGDWYDVWFTVKWKNGSVPTSSIAKSYLIYSHDEVYVSFVEDCLIDPDTIQEELLRVYDEEYVADIIDEYESSLPWIIVIMLIIFACGFCIAFVLPVVAWKFMDKNRKTLSADDFVSTINQKHWNHSINVLSSKPDHPISDYEARKIVLPGTTLNFTIAEAEDAAVQAGYDKATSSCVDGLDKIPDEELRKIISWFYETKEPKLRDNVLRAIEHYEPSSDLNLKGWSMGISNQEEEMDQIQRFRNVTKSAQILLLLLLTATIAFAFVGLAITGGFFGLMCYIIHSIKDLGSFAIAVSFQLSAIITLLIVTFIGLLFSLETHVYEVYEPAQKWFKGYPNSYIIGDKRDGIVNCVVVFTRKYTIYTDRYMLSVQIVELPSSEKVWVIEATFQGLPTALRKYLCHNSGVTNPFQLKDVTYPLVEEDCSSV